MSTSRHSDRGLRRPAQACCGFGDEISALGVLALGIGVGALFSGRLRPIAPELVIAGIAVHGWGMLRRHRLEGDAFGKRLWWIEAL
jgi:hypothetical protein